MLHCSMTVRHRCCCWSCCWSCCCCFCCMYLLRSYRGALRALYKYMVNYVKQKQQQKQQLQSLLPLELATLDTSLGGLLIIQGVVPLLRVPEYRFQYGLICPIQVFSRRSSRILTSRPRSPRQCPTQRHIPPLL